MKHEDKWNHFAGCFAAHNILAYTMISLSADYVVAVVSAAMATFFAGFLVEVYQERVGIDLASGWDVVADLVGIIASAFVLMV